MRCGDGLVLVLVSGDEEKHEVIGRLKHTIEQGGVAAG